MTSNDTNFGYEKIWLGLMAHKDEKKKSLEARADAFFRLKIQCWFCLPQSDSDMKSIFGVQKETPFDGMGKLNQQEKVCDN